MVKKKNKNNNLDVFEETLGAWRRAESPDEIREKIRKAFRRSIIIRRQ